LIFSLLKAMNDLAENDPHRLLSKRQIREALRWNNDKVTTAIEQAIEEGQVELQQRDRGCCSAVSRNDLTAVSLLHKQGGAGRDETPAFSRPVRRDSGPGYGPKGRLCFASSSHGDLLRTQPQGRRPRKR
jgi:hypothetical protein